MIGLIAPLTLLSLLTGNRVDASVNMRSASFQKTWIDNGFLERTYNSRSTFQGLFGFGWCSSLDIRLIIESPTKVSVENCGELIMFTKSDLKNLSYRSNDKRERLMDEPHYYIYFSPEGSKITFDRRGRMIRRVDGVRWLNVEYTSSRIRTLSSNVERRLNVTFDSQSKRITSLKSPSGLSLNYIYENENLVLVLQNGSLRFGHQYDEVHNMLRSLEKSTSKTDLVESLKYDIEKDLVLEYHRGNGCTETLDYQARPWEKGRIEIATAHVRCKDQRPVRIVHEFHYKKQFGAFLLLRVRSIVDDRIKQERSISSPPDKPISYLKGG